LALLLSVTATEKWELENKIKMQRTTSKSTRLVITLARFSKGGAPEGYLGRSVKKENK